MSGPFTEGPPPVEGIGSGVLGRLPRRRTLDDVLATAAGTPPRYPLDNDNRLAATHHGCLSALLDPFSQRRTRDLLAIDGGLRGRRCLDVGAGIGARYALWLASQVGPAGQVVAADVKPRDIPAHPQLVVWEWDLTSGAPVGEEFDFVHARLTLAHLPDRRAILTRLVQAVRPGGRILVEDWDATRTDMVLAAPSTEAAERFTLLQETVGRLFTRAGTDRGWARRVHAALLAEGLRDVHTVVHAESWPGGSAGTQVVGLTVDQLRPALLAVGLTDHQLDQVQQLLGDPRLVLAGHPLHSTSGRRPGG